MGCREGLESISIPEAFGQSQTDGQMARCCLSGIWLLHDFLEESHTISQGISTASGSFWHGIMHRREGDFSNAKYWFRKVGDHPLFDQLAGEVRKLGEAQQQLVGERGWDPFRFIDDCQSVVGSGSAEEASCRQIQQLEWELLFDYCYKAAIS